MGFFLIFQLHLHSQTLGSKSKRKSVKGYDMLLNGIMFYF